MNMAAKIALGAEKTETSLVVLNKDMGWFIFL